MMMKIFSFLTLLISAAGFCQDTHAFSPSTSIQKFQVNSYYYQHRLFSGRLWASDDDGEVESSHQPVHQHTETTSPDSFSGYRIRGRVKDLAKRLMIKPLLSAVPMPQAIAAVLKDATIASVDEIDAVMNTVRSRNQEIALEDSKDSLIKLVEEAFEPMESSLQEMELALAHARSSLEEAKSQSMVAIEAIQVAAIAQAEGAAEALAQAEQAAERQVLADIYGQTGTLNITGLTFEDIDFDSNEMAPPFLDESSCLVPGEPVCRVERAPENSRRIFAGIDIMASVEDVWELLTDYHNLQNVVPNLVVNEVLEMYTGKPCITATFDSNVPEEVQCKQLTEQMNGALLKQVGGAKVAGINFSAKTTLEVREWPQGLPDFAHFKDDMWEGKTRRDRAKEQQTVPLTRYRFPRPFATTSLPTKDISMQSILNDDGEFRMYQGVWRMQPLPGCARPGQDAMRLTYAVEISPRAYLPVRLVEGRIVQDLCSNLEAIRNAATAKVAQRELAASG